VIEAFVFVDEIMLCHCLFFPLPDHLSKEVLSSLTEIFFLKSLSIKAFFDDTSENGLTSSQRSPSTLEKLCESLFKLEFLHFATLEIGQIQTDQSFSFQFSFVPREGLLRSKFASGN
jgi:hypothetical protein